MVWQHKGGYGPNRSKVLEAGPHTSVLALLLTSQQLQDAFSPRARTPERTRPKYRSEVHLLSWLPEFLGLRPGGVEEDPLTRSTFRLLPRSLSTARGHETSNRLTFH
jgi:hypothetical protein